MEFIANVTLPKGALYEAVRINAQRLHGGASRPIRDGERAFAKFSGSC